ncbi:hypothetical protein GCM10010492_63810 [Saccharothrix mutabilis subsp. mutabilis]|uniref:Ricin B lectin domain-containing protein n=1 Tax=Saccharothrix mutabilis subsp. mutabilis TaxID=66855 RepID=A0ABP3E7X2_9PSEU
MEAHHLRPPEAKDAAEFVAAMRALRVRSGYSFRVLERRAANLGEVLPTSTLNSALSRSTLPREQIVVAFVRACGGDEETAAAWARVRADLATADLEPAAGEPGAAEAAPEPDPAPVAEPATPTEAIPAPRAETPAPETPLAEAPRAETPRAETPAPEAPLAEAPPAEIPPAETPPAETPPAPAETAPAPAVSVPAAAHPSAAVRRSRVVAVVAGIAAVVLALVLVAVLTSPPPSAGPNAASTSITTSTTTTTAAETTAATTAGTTAPAEAQAPAPQNPQPQPTPVTTTTTVDRPQPPPAGSPRDGIQRIRLGHTGLCVGEGQERFSAEPRIVLGQHDCATATPPTELERLPDGSYRIKLHNAQYGVGCATVDYGGKDTGVLIAGTNCGDRADQRFTLEPVNAGYRLHSVPGARYCVGVYGGSREEGVQLIQDPCDGGAHQVFQLG